MGLITSQLLKIDFFSHKKCIKTLNKFFLLCWNFHKLTCALINLKHALVTMFHNACFCFWFCICFKFWFNCYPYSCSSAMKLWLQAVHKGSSAVLVLGTLSNGSFGVMGGLQNTEQCYPMQKNITTRLTNEQVFENYCKCLSNFTQMSFFIFPFSFLCKCFRISVFLSWHNLLPRLLSKSFTFWLIGYFITVFLIFISILVVWLITVIRVQLTKNYSDFSRGLVFWGFQWHWTYEDTIKDGMHRYL